jgi:hypothetical protein
LIDTTFGYYQELAWSRAAVVEVDERTSLVIVWSFFALSYLPFLS